MAQKPQSVLHILRLRQSYARVLVSLKVFALRKEGKNPPLPCCPSAPPFSSFPVRHPRRKRRSSRARRGAKKGVFLRTYVLLARRIGKNFRDREKNKPARAGARAGRWEIGAPFRFRGMEGRDEARPSEGVGNCSEKRAGNSPPLFSGITPHPSPGYGKFLICFMSEKQKTRGAGRTLQTFYAFARVLSTTFLSKYRDKGFTF